MSNKIEAGSLFPALSASNADGEAVSLGRPAEGYDWRALFVYRGRHCPMCTRYLNKLEHSGAELASIGVDVVAVSGDSLEQLQEHQSRLEVSFPLLYGLTIDQMESLGLYISHPRSEQETDHPFPEPGLFVINENNGVHVVDISNNPFVRADIDTLVSGLKFLKDPKNNYPIRGTYQ